MIIKEYYWKLFGGWKYTIGFPQASLEDIMLGKPMLTKWLNHPYKDRWFADPFLLECSATEYRVLAEEFAYDTKKGIIVLLTIDKDTCRLKHRQVVLEKDTHLSFPIIYRIGGEVYITPENCGDRELRLYKYNRILGLFEKGEKIMEGDLTDTVITDLFGSRLLFTTYHSDYRASKLDVYRLNNKTSDYSYIKTINFDSRIARSAGYFFRYNNRVYRAAQECDVCYGHAVSIQEVVGENVEQLQFKEVRRLYSDNPDYVIGMHTFNVTSDGIVIDAMGYKNPIAQLISKFKRVLNK